MSEKLSTEKILAYVTSQPEFKEVLDQMAFQASDTDDDSPNDRNTIVNSPEYAKSYSFFANPKNWRREHKHRLDIEMYSKHNIPLTEFDLDVLDWGVVDEQLLDKAFQDYIASGKKKNALPVERFFYPKHDLSDNFRLEVYTTADDTQIICWTATVD